MATIFQTTAVAGDCDVAIVGAGPVGVFAGLLLAQKGLKVIIVEKAPEIPSSPRALVYHPQVNLLLERAGVLDDIRKVGIPTTEGIAWRWASDHSVAATAALHNLQPEDKPEGKAREHVLLGQHIFTRLILDKFREAGGEVWFETSYQSYEELDNKVRLVIFNSKHEESVLTAKFAIGADGGHSGLRRAIGAHLDGYTHDVNFVSVNFRYDKIRDTGFGLLNFNMDPRHDIGESDWSIIIHTGTDDIWRCAYGDSNKYTEEEMRKRVPEKLKRILPLHPDPDQYEVLLAQPYRVHQRCVPFFAKGRVILMGDAAHLNNPAGGLGMNTGLCDASVAADVILNLINSTDDTEIDRHLKEYSEARREAFCGFTNPVTIGNFRLLLEKSDEADKLRSDLFDNLKDTQFQREAHSYQNKMGLGIPGL